MPPEMGVRVEGVVGVREGERGDIRVKISRIRVFS